MGPRSKNRWGSIGFILISTLVAVVWAPIYVYRHGVSRPEAVLFLVYALATSFAITVGYHRHFAHATYKAGSIVRFLILFFGAAAFEQSGLKWASQHRKHHQFTDTDQDPYNIKRGFFYAHIGWILFWKQPVNYENVRDLQKDRMVMHQHEHYTLWSVVAGVLTPLLIGGFTGHWVGALVLCVALRLTLVQHSAFFINSFAHTFGQKNYDLDSSAKDHWLGAVLTNGEGYHNFHHRFPTDYRNGVLWYHWDPSKWFIYCMERLGVARDLKRTSESQIFQARIAADTRRASEALLKAS